MRASQVSTSNEEQKDLGDKETINPDESTDIIFEIISVLEGVVTEGMMRILMNYPVRTRLR